MNALQTVDHIIKKVTSQIGGDYTVYEANWFADDHGELRLNPILMESNDQLALEIGYRLTQTGWSLFSAVSDRQHRWDSIDIDESVQDNDELIELIVKTYNEFKLNYIEE